jgi:hypothetical protein
MSIVMQLNPYEFFVDTSGDALDSGYVWIGEINKDPRNYPVAVFYDEALTIPASMPLRTTNGYIYRNGSPTFLYINGNYSIMVLQKTGTLVYYVPDFLMIGSGQAVSSGDLANFVDPTLGAGLVGRATRQVNSLAELQGGTVVGRYNNDMVYLERHSAGYDGGGDNFIWNSTDVSTADGVVRVRPTGVVNGAWNRVYESLSIDAFGARPVAAFDNAVSFAACVTYLNAESVALRRVPAIEFKGAIYESSASPNWLVRGARYTSSGQTIINNTGPGYAWIMDGGAAGKKDGCTVGVMGNPFIIRGGPTTGGGLYVRAFVADGSIHMRCWGCGTAAAALRTEWIVGITMDFRAEPNDLTTGTLSWYLNGKPAAGISLGQRGAGEQTSYNLWLNCFTNACSVGKYLQNTLGNLFIGGDSEFNTTYGVLTESGALNDRFVGSNFEVNTTADFALNGHFLEMISCDSANVIIAASAQSIKLDGGNYDAINVLAGANSTLITSVKYSRGLGGAVITNSDPSTRFRDNKNLTTGVIENKPKTTTAGVITASPIVYTNSTGNPVQIYISGGTAAAGSPIVTQNGNNLVLPYPMSPVLVLPGNSFQFNYTVAPTTYFIIEGF